MKLNDASSKYHNTYIGKDLWRFGVEAWCNMKGRYMHIVADLSHYAAGTNYKMSICALGIMGTKYEHHSTIPTTVDVPLGQTSTIEIPYL